MKFLTLYFNYRRNKTNEIFYLNYFLSFKKVYKKLAIIPSKKNIMNVEKIHADFNYNQIEVKLQ